MFKNKVKSVGTISEFMHGKKANTAVKTAKPYGLVPLAVAPWVVGTKALASDGGQAVAVAGTTAGIYERMIHAFDPLIDLIQALAYPVAMIVVLGGALFIMIGNKEKGFAMMQGAGLGYVLVQLMPMVLNILVEAMKGAI